MNFDSQMISKIVTSAVVWIVVYLTAFGIVRIINTTISDVETRYRWRKRVYYLAVCIGAAVTAWAWMERLGALGTAIGLIGAGLAVALHQVILNMIGWLFIVVAKPFEAGHRIEWGSVKGDVIDVRVFHTLLLEIGNWVDADQSTGRIVYCPNGNIFSRPVHNYSRDFEFIWNEIKVLVTYESDWKKAEEILLKHARNISEAHQAVIKKRFQQMAKRYMIHQGKLSPIVYVTIADSGVELTLRYLTDAWQRRTGADEISRGILEDFAAEKDVDFAYPTYRITQAMKNEE
ncbi:MAG: mechanosensitive ion channel [Candidatus Latescibacteria bacterium]|nr:mechanosensitive ion channel [Candidatus Latescibacterota bacterium]